MKSLFAALAVVVGMAGMALAQTVDMPQSEVTSQIHTSPDGTVTIVTRIPKPAVTTPPAEDDEQDSFSGGASTDLKSLPLFIDKVAATASDGIPFDAFVVSESNKQKSKDHPSGFEIVTDFKYYRIQDGALKEFYSETMKEKDVARFRATIDSLATAEPHAAISPEDLIDLPRGNFVFHIPRRQFKKLKSSVSRAISWTYSIRLAATKGTSGTNASSRGSDTYSGNASYSSGRRSHYSPKYGR